MVLYIHFLHMKVKLFWFLTFLLVLLSYSSSGAVFPELHGEVYEDESEDFTAIPRIPNDS